MGPLDNAFEKYITPGADFWTFPYRKKKSKKCPKQLLRQPKIPLQKNASRRYDYRQWLVCTALYFKLQIP